MPVARKSAPPRRLPHSDEALQLIAARFRALGDPSRLRILNAIMDGERSVRDIVQATGLEQSNVSRHLGLLRTAGIVERRAEGTRGLYRVCDDTVAELCSAVSRSLAAQLAEDLDALQYEI